MTLPDSLAHWKTHGHGMAESAELTATQMDELVRVVEGMARKLAEIREATADWYMESDELRAILDRAD